VTLVYEEGIYEVEAINNLLISQNNKIILVQKPQTILKKTTMYYTNFHRTNHNAETCRVKIKLKSIPPISKVTINISKYKDL